VSICCSRVRWRATLWLAAAWARRAASAVRALLQGEPTHHWVWQSLAWSVGILVVFFTAAVSLYRNVTT